jgi:glutamate/tyrosine decarboxylase-like PLP-dependent enzyme
MTKESSETKFLSTLFKKFDTYMSQSKEAPVVTYTSPEEMKLKLLNVTNFDGKSLDELFPYIDFYLKHAVNTGHPQFFNQLFSGRNIAGVAGEWLSTLTNTSMYTYEMAPISSLLENIFLEKLNSYIGYKNEDGLFTHGGSNANLLAMLCARHERYPDLKKSGLFGQKPLVAFVSEEAHYSFLKAANLIGIGIDNIKKVPSNDSHEMDTDALEVAIIQTIREGKEPFFIAATAGTTVWGSYDPIEKIHEIASRYKLWFHVDGAHGGTALLSERHKSKLTGLPLSDSFTWDAHKMMGIPLVCTVFMVNNRPNMLREVSDNDDGGYLFHDNNKNGPSYDLGPKSFQCGRRVDVLKLWLTWSHYGDKGYETRINHCINLAEHAAEIIKTHPQLELVSSQQFVNVCFQYIPTDKTLDSNDFNEKLRYDLYHKGLSMVNQAKSNGKTFIRLITVNPDISTHDIQQFFDNVLKCGAELEMKKV